MRNGLILRRQVCLPSSTCIRSAQISHCLPPPNPFLRGIRQSPKRDTRGVKTRASIQLNDLAGSSKQSQHDIAERVEKPPAYPAVVSQARDNMRKYENCVLLTRVGSFYEVWL